MMRPHFLRLAQLDDERFVMACQHGIVHLTWRRTTMRLSRDELRQLASLLAQTADELLPVTLRQGDLRVTCRLDDDCEFQMGPLLLLLSAKQFQEFATMVGTAIGRMDKLLDSGVWDEQEAGESPPQTDFFEHFRKPLFSRN